MTCPVRPEIVNRSTPSAAGVISKHTCRAATEPATRANIACWAGADAARQSWDSKPCLPGAAGAAAAGDITKLMIPAITSTNRRMISPHSPE
ncbi:hypothetical protein GCM10009742_27460 [Kribbella karoonensis]|uniref:Uncharacterized protein n=1 Tax=Kribbella karoonensis TaxID=324851 RepID=A0ABN2DNC1_9ACTN